MTKKSCPIFIVYSQYKMDKTTRTYSSLQTTVSFICLKSLMKFYKEKNWFVIFNHMIFIKKKRFAAALNQMP